MKAPWAVSAGWAIDLFLGEKRREHEDLEIAVPAARFPEVETALGELEFHVVTRGTAEPVAQATELMKATHFEHIAAGIPYERPEVVLLFKANTHGRRTRAISLPCSRG